MRPIRLWLAAALACALLVLPAAPALPSARDYQQVVDLTFPTQRGARYADDYDSARSSGRAHRATDIVGTKGWEVYAAVGGEITWIPGLDGTPEPSYGYMISVRGDDGRIYHYVHLDNDTPGTDDGRGGPEQAYAPGLRKGSRVERGQWIARLGDSGNAEAGPSHLHFEIDDPRVTDPYGTNRINPYPSLQAAEARGDYAGDVAAPRPAPEVERIAGSDRVGTALALSRDQFARADHVVLAPSGAYPEAAVAGPLAAVLDGPVLLTPPTRLDDRVLEELRRLEVRRVTLVGGAAVLSSRVAHDLVQRLGLDSDGVRRVAGADRFGTAAAVANAVWARTGRSRVLVALGHHPEPDRAWPDALTSSWLGAVTATPVLLVGTGDLAPVTVDTLRGLSTATIVGGPAAVSREVEQQVDELVGAVTRRAGANRYATALAVAETAGASTARVWAATGRGWADALASAPAVARAGEVFVLIDGQAVGGDEVVGPWLAERAAGIRAGRVLGGRAVVTDEAQALFAERLAGRG